MKKISNKSLRFGVITILVVGLLVVFFVPFEQQIKGPGRFIANVEWTLNQVEQDKLQSNLIFHGIKKNDNISLFHFGRPDYIRLSLMPDQQIGHRLNAGDIVAQLVSAEDQLRFLTLRGELDEAQANLAALNTGEKEALQVEGQEAVSYAESQLEAYEPILQRQKLLFEKNLISEQELETSQAQYDLLKINVSLQEARLQAAKTGAKTEQIAIIESKITSVEQQLKIFAEKMDAEKIKTPITGILVQPDRSSGELCHVCDLDTVVVQMPIRATEIKYVEPGMTLQAFVSGSKRNVIKAKIAHIDRNATQINMQPMYIATAILDNKDGNINNGMTGYIKINAGTVTGWTLVKRAWANFHFNR